MGLFQSAVETYDNHGKYIGREYDHKPPFAPIGHMTVSPGYIITINCDGEFCDASEAGKHDTPIIIPVTEESAGRSSNAKTTPHPLCDSLKRFTGESEEGLKIYIDHLSEWADSPFSHPFLRPILTYVQGKTIMQDLQKCEVLVPSKEGNIPNSAMNKMVSWQVIGIEGEESACWKNINLMDSFIRFYTDKRSSGPKDFCMISGREDTIVKNYPKKLVPYAHGQENGKLISANDESGFTFLGRFTSSNQACTVGYEAVQKAHNAIKWLAECGGDSCVFGGMTFLCWNPNGKEVCHAAGVFNHQKEGAKTLEEYSENLSKELLGYKASFSPSDKVVIAIFDSPTKGRLSLVGFSEFYGSQYFQRLHDWELSCSWEFKKYGYQSPSLIKIVNRAFGSQIKEKGDEVVKAPGKSIKRHLRRLIDCKVNHRMLPKYFVTTLAYKASQPESYNRNNWLDVLSTACAVIKKYTADMKGVTNMSWDLDTNDRSFQYGRLLAVMDWMERSTYKSTDSDRQSNAIRAMGTFRMRPFSTFERINRRLQQAYMPRANGYVKTTYLKLTEEIISMITSFPETDLNKPLDEIYLIGYSLQMKDLYTPKKEKDSADSNTNVTTNGN